MIRLVVANGCSYTRGAELDAPHQESWPAVLGRILGVPVVNLASDGGSNRRIVRTTVANLRRLSCEHGVDLSNMAVVCMWTGITRDEFYSSGRGDRGKRPDLPDEDRWHRLGRWRIEEGDRASRAYFRYLWNEQGAAMNLFVDWIMFDAYIRSQSVAGRYVYAWDVLPKKMIPEARNLMAQVNASHVYGDQVQSNAGTSFYDSVCNIYETGALFHPLAPAHAYFAEKLACWLKASGLEFGVQER